MESQKYLIIVTLVDGQNFTVPDGAPDKIEATVFAEARFGNESILRSDPIKLTNSNPEFVTELAWQLDRKSLHQLRVERKAIKLQVFMQTRERKKNAKHNYDQSSTNGVTIIDPSEIPVKVELIGYTVIDIRSAQQREQPKFQWLPLLNPKFRKSSYNRPEVQLALTLNRVEENESQNDSDQFPSTSLLSEHDSLNRIDSGDYHNESHESDVECSTLDSRLYMTCLDTTINRDEPDKDEILDNDIIIRSKDGYFYIYDMKNPEKSSMEQCDERYKITVTIPFNSGLETLVSTSQGQYYFSISLFGAIFRTNQFNEATSTESREIQVKLYTTQADVLTTYFELNPDLHIKLHKNSGESIGIATIQLDQICSLDAKCRSIEGIFALQPVQENDNNLSATHPTIGVSVVLERETEEENENGDEQLNAVDHHIEMTRQHFGEDIDDFLFKVVDDTHQITMEDSNTENIIQTEANNDLEEPVLRQDDRHFCFTIDLKKFSYSPSQRLIPTLRELVVRYSYPFFGYKDTITTDASIPINASNSIIVSGFCEFNFATTAAPLLTALRDIPLNLEVLACDDTKLKDFDSANPERVVATCNLNLASTLDLDKNSITVLQEEPISKTISAPIYAIDGEEIGHLQIYLCLKDLGQPSYNFKASVENLHDNDLIKQTERTTITSPIPQDVRKLDAFIAESKSNFELWKEEYSNKLSEELRRSNNERFRRLYQRIEAKETKRDQEFKKKIEELNNIERKFKNSLACVESLEKMLADSFEKLKTTNSILDTRLDTMDLKISQVLNQINSRKESARHDLVLMRSQRSFDDNLLEQRINLAKVATKNASDMNGARRSSVRNANNPAGIPLPIRSSSLVRRPSEGSTSNTRLVKRTTGVVTTVVNGVTSRARSNSTRLNLSKDIQEKLANLRKEKAELLKRGCKPNDELIQEINSLIGKLAC